MDTKSDFEHHLQNIYDKMQIVPSPPSTISDDDLAKQERMRQEIENTKECLAICAHFSERVSDIRLPSSEDVSSFKDSLPSEVCALGGFQPAEELTASFFGKFQEQLLSVVQTLEERLQNFDNGEHRAIQEANNIQQCLSFFSQAFERAESFRTNVFENVSAAEDAHQGGHHDGHRSYLS